MSIEDPLKKKRNVTRRQKKNRCELTTCHISSPPALKYSSRHDKRGDDFYSWVNETWVSDSKIPSYETEYSVSDQVEECIMKTSVRIVNDCVNARKDSEIKTLYSSFVNKTTNIDLLLCAMKDVCSMRTKEDLVRQFARLTRYRLSSVIQLQYSLYHEKKKHKILSIMPDFPSLEEGFFSDSKIMHAYQTLLKGYGEVIGMPMEKVAHFEKTLSKRLLPFLDMNAPIGIGNGHTLARKFRKIPWKVYFEELGIHDWRKMKFEYNYPGFLRKLGIYMDEIPMEHWQLYVAKLYIASLAPFLPDPLYSIYFTFKAALVGQKEKEPEMHRFVNFIYDYLPDTFSKLFWDSCGDMSAVNDCKGICKDLRHAARNRLKETEWLQPSTRLAAIDKVNSMEFSIGRPDVWYIDKHPPFDKDIFLRNVFLLGEYSTQKMIQRIKENRSFWEQGIYRVNAYYYETFNQIVIPYAIITDPFYKKGGSRAWNYGSIGFTIGHEMCHGFDDEGKEYDSFGRKSSWWTRADNRAYNKKTRDIIGLYEKQNILGKHLDGVNTLGENIADIGGVGIALEALKGDMARRGVTGEDAKKEFRDFFISYAVGWRSLYRNKKLRAGIETDVHSPAYLRVNLVVSQFDEWYSAFDIQKGELFIEEKDRIRFF